LKFSSEATVLQICSSSKHIKEKLSVPPKTYEPKEYHNWLQYITYYENKQNIKATTAIHANGKDDPRHPHKEWLNQLHIVG
jgi:hypothetical protein